MRISTNIFWNLLKVHVLCFLLLFAGGCTLFEEQAAVIGEDRLTSHDHTRLPERIILNLTENPAESKDVTWQTCTQEMIPMVQIALFTESSDFEETARTNMPRVK